MNQLKVTQAVEKICSTGCTAVNAIIQTLEAGKRIEGTEDFNETEVIALKNELKSIMAVYDHKPE